jgi:hypothetical protein
VTARPGAFLCVTIDCERDKGPAWRARRPAAFDGVHVGIAERLQPLFRHHGAKPTYLLSPEVLRDGAAVERIAGLSGSCELGTHLHAEYADPAADDDAESLLFQAALPPAVERAKMEALTALFARAFGRRPRSFRAGRFGIGGASVEILASLGYTVDSSVTPFVDWSGVGPGAPCFRDAPVAPYRPDPADPARPGRSPLWEVPVTVRPAAWQRLPLVGRALGRRLRQRWLRPSWGSTRALLSLAKQVLSEPASPTILNVMFHNVEVVPGASPYARTPAQADGILRRLAALLAFARDAGVASVGLGDLPAVLPAAPGEVPACT